MSPVSRLAYFNIVQNVTKIKNVKFCNKIAKNQNLVYNDRKPTKKANPKTLKAMKTMTTINILEIAQNIEVSAKKLHEQARNSEKPIALSAGLLAKKYPELKALKPELVLVKIRVDGNDIIHCDSPTVFRSSDDLDIAEIVCLGLEDEKIEFVNFKTGYGGFCIIKLDKSILKIRISCNDDHAFELEDAEIDGYEGDGKPPIAALKIMPQPEIPLVAFEVGSKFKILALAGKTRKYETDIFNIENIDTGEIFKNVISNSTLRAIWEKYGEKSEFEIVEKFKKVNKKGELIVSKNEQKPVCEVRIRDLKSPDLTDLDFEISEESEEIAA